MKHLSSKKILVFGKNGQIATQLALACKAHQLNDVNFVSSSECDFVLADSKPQNITQLLDQYQPNIVINTSAYTAVDLAETETKKAEALNVLAPKIIAEWCKKNNVIFVHYSSDYVYGESQHKAPHLEDEPYASLSHYGKTKAQGDLAIQQSGCNYLVFRTSWVYAEEGKNFLLTMLKLSAKDELKIVSDQWGAPSYACDLASATLKALEEALKQQSKMAHFPLGVYHMCNAGEINWSGFAEFIFKKAYELQLIRSFPKVIPISTEEYAAKAIRPKNSRLSMEKFKNQFGFVLRPWEEATLDVLSKLVKAKNEGRS